MRSPERSDRLRARLILALAGLFVALSAAALLKSRAGGGREADFSSIRPGMSETEVVALLGPADDGLTHHGTAYVVWSTEERSLVIYFDDEGRVAAEPVLMEMVRPGFLQRLARWLGW